MSRRRARLGGVALVALALVAIGCTGSRPSWTFGPAGTPAPATPAPSGSPAESSPPAPTAGASPTSSTAAAAPWTLVGSTACPESRFECVTLAVPRDHSNPGSGETWNVTYAIQRAAKERLGTFVYIVGGPGGSGISVADSYTDVFDPAITDAYDIVYVDQRGIGQSEPIQCIDAAAAFYRDPNRAQLDAERAGAAAAAERFARDCIAEAGIDPADLPLYATTQAIEDLEAIRDQLGADQLNLFGESYGTQFVQQYAAAYPDRVAALFVDGPVDLTVDGIDYYIEAARSADDTLTATLRACTADETCAADIEGGDALAAYDALAERLAVAPIAYDFPKADGTVESRQLTSTDLENAAFGYIYSPADRESLQRAVAAASRDNLVPIARLAYGALGMDPETETAEEDPTWSDAMYYSVECQDYAFLPDVGDPTTRLEGWVEAGATSGVNDTRLATSFYGDLPCLYWPAARSTTERPEPLTDVPFPVFVLTSTTDPATPIVNGYRIYSRLDDAWFFQTLGGPHVIFGWGETCPDTEIAAYLADGTLPPARVTTCDGAVASTYVPIAPAAAAGYDDALAFMQSIDDQVLNTDDYLARLDDEPISAGCDFGGSLTYTPSDVGTDIVFDACEFTDGLALTGTAASDDEAGTFEIRASVDDEPLVYERDAEGETTVSGTYQGERVRRSS